ncbi:MAG: PQQ-dependent sugar dehydrogenase [Nocardioides sp.]|uniref:PQQ-dependent sugar dehydrogenase n=1 Tax=Nocardioides sp. TaxID=35761 RepID=UPI003EFD7765
MRVSRGVTVPLAAVTAGLLLPALALGPVHAAPDRAAAPASPTAARAVPDISVSTVVSGLEHVWDVALLQPGRLLVSERDSATISIVARGRATPVRFPSSKVWVSGETGLMSLAVVPGTKHRTFLTCSGWETSDGHEIQVRRWRLSADGKRAVDKGKVLGGIPIDSGRHGGCRVKIDSKSGDIWVGTGDAATYDVARNLHSLGGKVLRMTAAGKPSPHNPWPRAASVKRRYIYTYGHRNVQGLARRPGGEMWSVEHGTDRDDEVNLLKAGGDYGWNPGPGYDDDVPMTDHSLPGEQIDARWSSGDPTIATSGAAWVRGSQWGDLNGTLAVATLAGEKLVFMKFDDRGRFVRMYEPRNLQTHGRLRSVTSNRKGDLLVTTDNGRRDKVLRISPVR